MVVAPVLLGHHTIYPTERMSFDDYIARINGMNWERIGVKL